ncbi:hypothetical protein B6N60_01020 [Richelia sinica FACHB-800]|uniref:Uncharacterized protein n=1 Tax=Richelia sinica FACHB-800 TaxID=1357546 RepID=A0A975T6G0_9NOST|nr:T3SS effector HopA1 family protein [Richelia sinica]MBD2664911.1 hypothetical protein [Richelia sinica FACHB-800]QXE22337.1 hypothetical protein B6N60_01020 [Richelia sinica FACHB-800]
MQLLDSHPQQWKNTVESQLLDVLQDIVHKIEIHADFSIHHADYQSLKLPPEVVERFQKMPLQMQQKYMSLQLRSFLYGIYYNGSMRSALALDNSEHIFPIDLENNTVLGVDVSFYERLHESNYGEGYFDLGWSVIREEAEDILVVTKGGLKLHIQREKHLKPVERSALVGDLVAIRLPKNRVQNGFYMAVSNLGFGYLAVNGKQPVTVRIYFNLTPEGSVAVMKNLTQHLNDLEIPFCFKVLYNPKEYRRTDSGVLYFDQRDYTRIREILQVIYEKNQSYFQPDIPLFTKRLAPGLGLAEEPNQKFAEKESFGMNRCQIVANGLLTAWYKGEESPEKRMQAIYEQFNLLRIDLKHIYLNPESEDIYQSLN